MEAALGLQQAEVDGTCDKLTEFTFGVSARLCCQRGRGVLVQFTVVLLMKNAVPGKRFALYQLQVFLLSLATR